MQNIKRFWSSDDSGLTLIEIIISLVVTSALAVGLAHIADTSLTAMAYTESTAIKGANSASLNEIFNKDLSQTVGVVVPSSNFVNSNVCMTLSNTLVSPLLTLNTQSEIPVTHASWDATQGTATFIYSGPQISLTVNQRVDISGMTNTLLNATGLTLVSSSTSAFTVLYPAATSALFDIGNEIETTSAGAVIYKWVGYELHPNAATGTTDLWRVQCAWQGAVPDANGQILRTGFDPNINWSNAVQCTFATMTSASCAQDILLNSANANAIPAITLNLPATVAMTSPLYQRHSAVYGQEILLAATSLS